MDDYDEITDLHRQHGEKVRRLRAEVERLESLRAYTIDRLNEATARNEKRRTELTTLLHEVDRLREALQRVADRDQKKCPGGYKDCNCKGDKHPWAM